MSDDYKIDVKTVIDEQDLCDKFNGKQTLTIFKRSEGGHQYYHYIFEYETVTGQLYEKQQDKDFSFLDAIIDSIDEIEKEYKTWLELINE